MGEYLTTEQQMPEARRRVALGAALLDEKRPGWRDRIVGERFDIAEPCDCAVGQEFGPDFSASGGSGIADDPYEFGLDTLGIDHSINAADENEHGFNAGTTETSAVYVSYIALQDAWMELLDPVAS